MKKLVLKWGERACDGGQIVMAGRLYQSLSKTAAAVGCSQSVMVTSPISDQRKEQWGARNRVMGDQLQLKLLKKSTLVLIKRYQDTRNVTCCLWDPEECRGWNVEQGKKVAWSGVYVDDRVLVHTVTRMHNEERASWQRQLSILLWHVSPTWALLQTMNTLFFQA